MSISEEDVLKVGKTTEAIRIPPEFGGGFMASVEVNHQLHCVVSESCASISAMSQALIRRQNFLRKSLHRDYYQNRSVEFSDEPEMVATHLGQPAYTGQQYLDS